MPKIDPGLATIIAAVIGVIGVLVGGYFVIRAAQEPFRLERAATQKAEAQLPTEAIEEISTNTPISDMPTATSTSNSINNSSVPQNVFIRWSCGNTYTVEAGGPIELQYGIFVARGIELLEENVQHLRIEFSIDDQSLDGVQLPPEPISSIPCGDTYSDEAYWTSYRIQLDPLNSGEHIIELTYILDKEITNGYDTNNFWC